MLPKHYFQNIIKRNLACLSRTATSSNRTAAARKLVSRQSQPDSAPRTISQLTLFAKTNLSHNRLATAAQENLQAAKFRASTIVCGNSQKAPFLQAKRSLVSHKRRSVRVSETKLPRHFKMEWPKITLFGDSITRRSFDPEFGCWASYLAHRVGNYFDVDQRGFEGYTSEWALEVMPKLFPKSYLEKVELFVVFYGHNDSWDERFPTHLSASQYEANMRLIVKYLLENGIERRKIILITPTWFHQEQLNKFLAESNMPLTGKSLERAKEFSEAILRIGSDENLEVVDFFSVSAKHQPLAEMFCDGVHFSRVGAKMLFDLVMPVVERKIEASFKKPLADLWHVIPFDQHPKVKPVIEAYQEQLRKSNLVAEKD